MFGGGEVIADALVSGTPRTGVGVTTGVEAGATSAAFASAVGGTSIEVGSGAGGFVGSGLGGSFVGEGSTIALAKTLASGDGVSAI